MQEDNENVANDKLNCEGKRSFAVNPTKTSAYSTNYEGESRTMRPFVPVGGTIVADNPQIGNDMMAVARRIRERAQILKDEKQKAEKIRGVLLDICKKRDAEIAINNRQRRRLLQATNERNEVELEIFEVQESIEDCRNKARAMGQETLESEERIRSLGERRTEQAISFYGPNMAKMDTFIKVFEDIVESKAKAVEARRKHLEELRSEIKVSKEREKEILRKTKEIKELIDLEEKIDDESGDDTKDERQSKGSKYSGGIRKEDEEIIALASKVRETIAVVSLMALHCIQTFVPLFLAFSKHFFFRNIQKFESGLLCARSSGMPKRNTTRQMKTYCIGRGNIFRD